MGLALRPGLLVVRLRLLLVSRLATLGLPAAHAVLVAAPAAAARTGRRPGGRDRTRRHGEGRDRHRPAKAIHPDEDHSYTITAEVVDQSRRTIVGTGTVLVARQPFKVYAWVDRGYYRVGDAIHAHFSARTLDGKPVVGSGELRLLRITYKDGKPVETPVQTWPLDTDAEGTAQQQMTASQAGQYRLSYKVSQARGRGERGEGRGKDDDSASGIDGGTLGIRDDRSEPDIEIPHPHPSALIPRPSKAATSSPSPAKALTARNSASIISN